MYLNKMISRVYLRVLRAILYISYSESEMSINYAYGMSDFAESLALT